MSLLFSDYGLCEIPVSKKKKKSWGAMEKVKKKCACNQHDYSEAGICYVVIASSFNILFGIFIFTLWGLLPSALCFQCLTGLCGGALYQLDKV